MYSEQDLLFNIPEKSILKIAHGNFARRVFVASLSEPDFPENTAFLEKVLKAAGMDLEKDTLFAEITEIEQYSFLPLVKEKQTEYVLVFGIPANHLGLHVNMPLYQPISFYTTTFLFADKLSTLVADKNMKAKLWQSLQLLFLK